MTIDLLPEFIRENYEIHEWKHACAVLAGDFPEEWNDMIAVLTEFRLRKGYITRGGGDVPFWYLASRPSFTLKMKWSNLK